jgi:hypothetical protein
MITRSEGEPPTIDAASAERRVAALLVATRICPLASNRSFTLMNVQSGEFEVRRNLWITRMTVVIPVIAQP